MDSTSEQIFEQIKKSNKILIALPQNLTADSLSSGLALWLFLNKMQKKAVAVSSGQIPENLKFLPDIAVVQKQIKSGTSLVVTLDTSEKKLEEVSYQTAADKVHIYLKAQNAEFSPEDISFAQEKSPTDLVIALGVKSLEELGKVYEQSADIFFETPKINIDNKADNDYFGQINLVDVTATSIAEILAEMLQKYEDQLLDEDIATCLLAGIIANTNSFQHAQTTPKAFFRASELVSLGGRQQEIIKNIFKTKSLALLKLWGRALARMKIQDSTGVIYSILAASDFEKSQATGHDLLPVLREFIANISGYNIIGLIAEPAKDSVKILVAVHDQIKADELVANLGPGAKLQDFTVGNFKIIEMESKENLEQVENKFTEAIN